MESSHLGYSVKSAAMKPNLFVRSGKYSFRLHVDSQLNQPDSCNLAVDVEHFWRPHEHCRLRGLTNVLTAEYQQLMELNKS